MKTTPQYVIFATITVASVALDPACTLSLLVVDAFALVAVAYVARTSLAVDASGTVSGTFVEPAAAFILLQFSVDV